MRQLSPTSVLAVFFLALILVGPAVAAATEEGGAPPPEEEASPPEEEAPPPEEEAPPPPDEPLVLVLEESSVGATGLTPGGEIAWLGAGRAPMGAYRRLIYERRVEVDAAGTGEARLELGVAVPSFAAFFAVDVANGEVAAASPAGSPFRLLEVPAAAWAAALAPAGLAELPLGHRWLELLVVRPGVGAWGLTLRDGGAADADGAADGGVTAALGALEPLGEGAAAAEPFAALAPGDVLLALDPERLIGYAAEVPAPPPGAPEAEEGGAS